MEPIFRGSAVALITPFRNGEVDLDAISGLVEYQLEGGTASILACGTTGEPSTMSLSERESVVREVVRRVGGRVPVIAGTGSNSTAAVIESAKRFENLGCAAQLVVTPYYNKTTQEGLYRHYMTIAEKTALPIIIYNVPSRTGLEISPDTLDRLAVCENIAGIKESSYDMPLVMEKMRRAGGRVAFYSGNDDMVLPLMALGAEGVVSVVSNIYPGGMARLAESCLAGDMEAARGMQLTLLPLVRALFCEVSPIPCKAAAEMLGLCTGEMRLPLVDISPENRENLRGVLEGLGLIK